MRPRPNNPQDFGAFPEHFIRMFDARNDDPLESRELSAPSVGPVIRLAILCDAFGQADKTRSKNVTMRQCDCGTTGKPTASVRTKNNKYDGKSTNKAFFAILWVITSERDRYIALHMGSLLFFALMTSSLIGMELRCDLKLKMQGFLFHACHLTSCGGFGRWNIVFHLLLQVARARHKT